MIIQTLLLTFIFTKYVINYVYHLRMKTQALVSFKKYMSPPLPYFKVNICPFPLPHFASIFFAYLWFFRWPNYTVILPRYFSFRLPHLSTPTGPPSDELDKNIQRTSLGLLFSHWNGWKKPEYPERTTEHGQATGIELYHLRLRVECTFLLFTQPDANPRRIGDRLVWVVR